MEILIRRAQMDDPPQDHDVGIETGGGSNGLISSSITTVEELAGSLTLLQQPVRMTNKESDTTLHAVMRSSGVRYCLREFDNDDLEHPIEIKVKLLMKADLKYEYSPNNACETPLFLVVDQASMAILVKEMLETCPTLAHTCPHSRAALHAAVVFGAYIYCGRNFLSINKIANA